MNENKNLIFAVVFSIAILLSWELFFSSKIKTENPPQKPVATATTNTQKAIQKEIKPDDIFVPLPKDVSLQKTRNQRLSIKSENLLGSVDLKGLRFDDLSLPNYKETIKPDSKNITILSPKDTKGAYFIELGWLSSDEKITLPNNDSVWQASEKEIIPNKPVIFTWNNKKGLIFSVKLELDDHYLFKVEQTVKNTTKEKIILFPYALINRIRDDGEEFFISHEGPILVADNLLEEINYSKVKEKSIQKENIHGWLGFTDKYWMSAIIPQDKFSANISYYKQASVNRYQIDYRGEAVLLDGNSKAKANTKFIIGAKKLTQLDSYAHEYNIPLLDRAVDFGWFYFITKPMSIALNFLGHSFGNFGLAILLFTVFVKVCLFPLAYKSYVSMGKLRELMPELNKIKEKYKGDQVQFNKELMGFYKKRGVNPAAGCLPILLQIPIFFALYKVLFVTIEMRHAPFIGWIKDLSAPDSSSIFNLFGLLNYTVPNFLPYIGILPILFCISMIIQQRLQPKPTDETQAFIMKVLPFVFLFVFASFPAGLVIYWTWSNALSILQQVIINYKIRKKEIK
ncbi:MAG: membrane protein insertase YidC [Alphaproteobacteria bacterium]